MIQPLFFFCCGLLLLTVGAEFLVRGASLLARALGVPPLVVGLTIVAFGTGTPELVVSAMASLSGKADISVGNVVGSNIMNILLVLGSCAAISPLVIQKQVIWRDVPIMIAVSFVVMCISMAGSFSALVGIGFLLSLAACTLFIVSQALNNNHETDKVEKSHSVVTELILIISGIGLLIYGSRWVVSGSVEVAKILGVSELVIGLTLVSIGTSLPEFATSVVATIKGERDIAVGNIIGSCIFNLLGVLGIAALIAPEGLLIAPSVVHFDFPFLVATSVACLPIFFTGHVISRWEGWLFLGYYAVYLTYLFLRAERHDALPAFNQVMWFFVIPLTVVTLIVSVSQSMKRT